MRQPDLAAVLTDVRSGLIPAHVYNDPEIFALERERLFSRAWVFLAHESEIPQPGDYVVRRVLADSFIVVRDEHSAVRVMFNMCLHRGMQVCRAEMGNASHFRCPYHAWTYRNDGRLVGLPFHGEAYGGEDGFARLGVVRTGKVTFLGTACIVPAAQAEVPAGLDEGWVDPVQARVQHQDQVRDVAVDQAEDDRERLAAQPVDGRRRGGEVQEVQRFVHVTVDLQQVDPGQHPHHVADPERGDQQYQE